MSARLRGGKTAMLLVLVLVAARWSLAVPCLSPCATAAAAGARSSTAAHCADAASDGPTVTGECDMMRAQAAPATASSTERPVSSEWDAVHSFDHLSPQLTLAHRALHCSTHLPQSPPGGMRPLRI